MLNQQIDHKTIEKDNIYLKGIPLFENINGFQTLRNLSVCPYYGGLID